MNPQQDPAAHTEIAYILDRSGSMQGLVRAAIDGFNQFLRDQQEAEGIARLTLVQFDDRYEIPADNLPVCEVVSLDAETYVPRGSTALLDAIGITIDAFKARIRALPEGKRPGKVIFAIFTDGLENSSVKFTWKQLAGKIRRRQDQDGWEFLFLAANQDAIATAAQLSIHAHHSATVHHDAAGYAASTRGISRKIRAMRAASLNEPAPGSEAAEDISKSMREILREEEERGRGDT